MTSTLAYTYIQLPTQYLTRTLKRTSDFTLNLPQYSSPPPTVHTTEKCNHNPLYLLKLSQAFILDSFPLLPPPNHQQILSALFLTNIQNLFSSLKTSSNCPNLNLLPNNSGIKNQLSHCYSCFYLFTISSPTQSTCEL